MSYPPQNAAFNQLNPAQILAEGRASQCAFRLASVKAPISRACVCVSLCDMCVVSAVAWGELF